MLFCLSLFGIDIDRSISTIDIDMQHDNDLSTLIEIERKSVTNIDIDRTVQARRGCVVWKSQSLSTQETHPPKRYRPDELHRHEVDEARRPEVEEVGKQPPDLEPRQCGLLFQLQYRWEVVIVCKLSQERGHTQSLSFL
jgi:hypothetical protein